MTRTLGVDRPTRDAAALLQRDPSAWLPPPARPAGPQQWEATLRLGRLHRASVVEVGDARLDGDDVHRSVSWHVRPEHGDILPYERLMPPFRGTLTGTVDRLRVRGDYDPPAGPLGRGLDLLLSRFARRTLGRLLDDIAARRDGDVVDHDQAVT